MNELLQSLRPLIHPMLVHFPIALLFASVALDWLGWGLRRPSLTRAGFYTLVLGTAGAGVAALSGPDHSSGGPAVQSLLVSHQSFALMTVALAVALLVVRWAAVRGLHGWGALAYLASTLVLLATLSLTGYYGGELTYHQGVGVATTSSGQSASTSSSGGGEGGGSVPVKSVVVLLGLLASGMIVGWVAMSHFATQGYFAEWGRAVRRDDGSGAGSGAGGGALWTLRRDIPLARDASEPYGEPAGVDGQGQRATPAAPATRRSS